MQNGCSSDGVMFITVKPSNRHSPWMNLIWMGCFCVWIIFISFVDLAHRMARFASCNHHIKKENIDYLCQLKLKSAFSLAFLLIDNIHVCSFALSVWVCVCEFISVDLNARYTVCVNDLLLVTTIMLIIFHSNGSSFSPCLFPSYITLHAPCMHVYDLILNCKWSNQ